MEAWLTPVLIMAGGAAGGIVNAMMTENGFVLPVSTSASSGGAKIWRPGIVGNVVVSAVAALVSWGLYGSGASLLVFSAPEAKDPGLTYAALVGAILIGIGGARWLTAEVDKNLFRGAAIAAANKDPSQTLAGQLAVSSPAEAYAAATANP